jgi:uncharacterized protein YggE
MPGVTKTFAIHSTTVQLPRALASHTAERRNAIHLILTMRLRILALALLPLRLPAQVVRDSVITVSASRTSRVAPDRASLYLIVEGTAETPTDAVARVDAKLKLVSEALKALGSRVALDPPVAYGVGPSPATNGYSGMSTPATNLARSVMRVQLNRPEQTANVVAAAIGAGAASSSSLTFESSVADSVRRARIGDALNVARMDAEAIASSLGAHLGTLVGVSTSGGSFGFQPPSMLNFDNRFGQQSSVPEITLTTTVTVQYRLIR